MSKAARAEVVRQRKLLPFVVPAGDSSAVPRFDALAADFDVAAVCKAFEAHGVVIVENNASADLREQMSQHFATAKASRERGDSEFYAGCVFVSVKI